MMIQKNRADRGKGEETWAGNPRVPRCPELLVTGWEAFPLCKHPAEGGFFKKPFRSAGKFRSRRKIEAGERCLNRKKISSRNAGFKGKALGRKRPASPIVSNESAGGNL